MSLNGVDVMVNRENGLASSHGKQFFVLIGLCLACMVGIALLSSLVLDFLGVDSKSASGLRVAQGVYLIGSFALPVILWHAITGRSLGAGLRVSLPWGIVTLFGVLASLLSLYPSAYAGYLNLQADLPDWLLRIEQEAERVLRLLLEVDSVWLLLANLLVVALLPAVCEELFFRMGVQGVLQRWIGNRHAAVWIAAAIFSFFHLQFLGFLPRMLVGAVLGYLYSYSGTIWTSVVAHFINNAIAVVVIYLVGYDAFSGEAQYEAVALHWYVVPLCLVLLVGVLLSLRRFAMRNARGAGRW